MLRTWWIRVLTRTQWGEKACLAEVEELVMHLIMKCNDEPSVSAAKSVTYGKGLRETITFILKVSGGNIVTCTQRHNYLT